MVLAWGTMWPVNKALLAYMPPIWSIALRTCISALALFTISLGVTGLAAPKRGDAPVLISMVLLHMVGFTILTQLALQIVPAGQSTVLAYTSVLWAPIFAALFLGERLSLRRAAGARARRARPHRHLQPRDVRLERPRRRRWQRSDPAGRHAVGGQHRPQPRARRGARHRSSWPPGRRCWRLWFSVLVAAVFEGPPAVQWNAHSALLLLFAGIPGTALAYWAAAVSSSELPASTTSLGLMVTPAVSIFISMAMLGEQPTVSLIAALALILVGVAVGISGAGALAAPAAFVLSRRRTAAHSPCRGSTSSPLGWRRTAAASTQAGSMPLCRMIGAAAGAVR